MIGLSCLDHGILSSACTTPLQAPRAYLRGELPRLVALRAEDDMVVGVGLADSGHETGQFSHSVIQSSARQRRVGGQRKIYRQVKAAYLTKVPTTARNPRKARVTLSGRSLW